jgi:hypothetical protein
MFRIKPFFQQTLFGQRRQSAGQHRGCYPQTFPELVKASETGMGIAQDQYAPCITSNRHAARDWAWGIVTFFHVHTVLIVTWL